jgi:hypothetical protein
MKTFLLSIAWLMFASTFAPAQSAAISVKDLKRFEGDKWIGTLTYMDYRSNRKTSIKSNLTVARKNDGKDTWVFAYEYPDEPKANKLSEAVLSDGGKKFFGETVVERSRLTDKSLKIVTTQTGSDNDRKAMFRYTYLVSSKSLSIKKEVQIDGKTEWFERNAYSWRR